MVSSLTDREAEDYLVLILSDSNLPTGGFIASAGLESYYSHGFLTHGQEQLVSSTLSFVEHTLANYATSVLPYMCAAYALADKYVQGDERALDAIGRLDWHHHTLLLNHVSRRASLIQGMALLTLYMRSFAPYPGAKDNEHAQPEPKSHDFRARTLVEQLRQRIRRGGAKLSSGAMSLSATELAGHLAICTGVFSCCVGLSVERMIHVNLFLQARNLMSCSIRLNTLGPYLAHQLLATKLRHFVSRSEALLSRHASEKLVSYAYRDTSQSEDAWLDDELDDTDMDVACTTWPLGDIVQARHDQLHSRLFNS